MLLFNYVRSSENISKYPKVVLGCLLSFDILCFHSSYPLCLWGFLLFLQQVKAKFVARKMVRLIYGNVLAGDNKHNKLFNSGSARVAFLLCVGFSVYGVMVECCGNVAHHLSGCYLSTLKLV